MKIYFAYKDHANNKHANIEVDVELAEKIKALFVTHLTKEINTATIDIDNHIDALDDAIESIKQLNKVLKEIEEDQDESGE